MLIESWRLIARGIETTIIYYLGAKLQNAVFYFGTKNKRAAYPHGRATPKKQFNPKDTIS